jgi:hypothetical protein
MVIEIGERTGADCSQVYIYLGWWSLPSTRSVGAISVIGYLVPQPFAIGGNQTISRFAGP